MSEETTYTLTDTGLQAAEFLHALESPDPDPEALPAIADTSLPLQMETAGHLVRAILRAEASVEQLEEQARKDAQAWANMIDKAQARADAWRAIVLDWMQRNEVKQIKTPWFTGYVKKGGSKILIDDQDIAIHILKELGAIKAIKTTESIVKKEFNDVFNAVPDKFKGVAHEETGDPSLVIKRSET